MRPFHVAQVEVLDTHSFIGLDFSFEIMRVPCYLQQFFISPDGKFEVFVLLVAPTHMPIRQLLFIQAAQFIADVALQREIRVNSKIRRFLQRF